MYYIASLQPKEEKVERIGPPPFIDPVADSYVVCMNPTLLCFHYIVLKQLIYLSVE